MGNQYNQELVGVDGEFESHGHAMGRKQNELTSIGQALSPNEVNKGGQIGDTAMLTVIAAGIHNL